MNRKRVFNPLYLFCIILLILFLYVVVWLDLSSLSSNRILVNVKTLSTLLLGFLPMLLLVIIIFGLLTNKWAIKIEKVSLGGFNVLFDNPVSLYKRSVRSFLDTKRTLFYIDFDRDNFDETLSSYYKTYEFFRNEIKILENKKERGRRTHKEQEELYSKTNEILQVLNEFLTSHQNNYRRWYKHISEKNELERIDGSGDLLEFYLTPIHEVQKHYYRYEEICKGFNEINNYFRSDVNSYFHVNLQKWERVD